MKTADRNRRPESDASDERLVIYDLLSASAPERGGAEAGGADRLAADFAADVRRGLTAERKHLAPKYFYDDLGSLLFDAICLTPEYYLTRAEDEILRRRADEIVARALDPAPGDESKSSPALSLLELGGGSGEKTRRLVEAALRRQPRLDFSFVDISSAALDRAARLLLQTYPGLRVEAYAADYDAALARLAANSDHTKREDERTLAIFLGSNVGNFDPGEAADFLRRLRSVLRAGDALLVGADLRPGGRKTRARLVAAYDDALGVTAAFNRNLLSRINRELGADFDPRLFRHVALYDDGAGRVEMHLESARAHIVRIAALDLEVTFAAGERIHTENSYKHDARSLGELAALAGFCLEQTWTDAEDFFGSNLFRAC